MNYARIYQSIISSAKDRANIGYVEKHHIIPKAEGGTNEANNLVNLTGREHFLAHWLLFKIYKSPAMARAFRLMADTNGKLRGRGYQEAKAIYANTMLGDLNVAKRIAVRAKISVGVIANHAWRGKKRPEHAKIMAASGHWRKENNPCYGTGERQVGSKNHMAVAVVGVHPIKGTSRWETMVDAASSLGVSVASISQAIRKKYKSQGWKLERIV